MAFSPEFSLERSSDCITFFFEDTTCACVSGYLAPNPTKAEVTLTKIIVADSSGNEWEYTDYLPTEGEIELTYDSFTQTEEAAAVVTDTGCGCTTEETTTSVFEDKCYTWTYEVYTGVGGTTLAGSASQSSFFYCNIRNSLYDIIEGTCNECCDAEKQLAIHTAKTNYDIMLITYNKVGCSCAEGLLAQLQKQVAKIEGNC